MRNIFLAVVVMLGSATTTWAQMMNFIQDLAWSPDSKAIYFSSMRVRTNYSDYHPGRWKVFKYTLADKSIVMFADSALNITVSPNGKQFAVGKLIKGNRDIVLLDTEGRQLRSIGESPLDEYAPAWSPDGERIAFTRTGIARKNEIFLWDLESNYMRQITNGQGRASNYTPTWSPDGKHITYYAETGDSRDQIYVINADGSNQINVTQDTCLNYYPSWFDNNTIMYTQSGKGKSKEKTFTVSADGKEKKMLFELNAFYSRKSPDGEMIAYINNSDKTIKIISLKGKLLDTMVIRD